jgi:hypothetical protein
MQLNPIAAAAGALGMLLLPCCLATPADSVCEDLSFCGGQTTDQLNACQKLAKSLRAEAATSKCSAQYDAYFSCAESAYDCQGNKALFPGCEAARAALDACLAQGRAGNACGQLEEKLAACPGRVAPVLPAPCGAAEDCEARCYLDRVADACAPSRVELSAYASCTSQCL